LDLFRWWRETRVRRAARMIVAALSDAAAGHLRDYLRAVPSFTLFFVPEGLAFIDYVAALPVPELVHSVGRFERAMWLARFEPQRPPTVIEFAGPRARCRAPGPAAADAERRAALHRGRPRGRRALAHRDRRRRRRAGEVDDYLAAVTMISTSRPGKTSCGDTTHARTGALSGSTHSFHASLWAAKCFMSVSHTCAVSSFAFEVPAVASSSSIRAQIRRV